MSSFSSETEGASVLGQDVYSKAALSLLVQQAASGSVWNVLKDPPNLQGDM